MGFFGLTFARSVTIIERRDRIGETPTRRQQATVVHARHAPTASNGASGRTSIDFTVTRVYASYGVTPPSAWARSASPGAPIRRLRPCALSSRRNHREPGSLEKPISLIAPL